MIKNNGSIRKNGVNVSAKSIFIVICYYCKYLTALLTYRWRSNVLSDEVDTKTAAECNTAWLEHGIEMELSNTNNQTTITNCRNQGQSHYHRDRQNATEQNRTTKE